MDRAFDDEPATQVATVLENHRPLTSIVAWAIVIMAGRMTSYTMFRSGEGAVSRAERRASPLARHVHVVVVEKHDTAGSASSTVATIGFGISSNAPGT